MTRGQLPGNLRNGARIGHSRDFHCWPDGNHAGFSHGRSRDEGAAFVTHAGQVFDDQAAVGVPAPQTTWLSSPTTVSPSGCSFPRWSCHIRHHAPILQYRCYMTSWSLY